MERSGLTVADWLIVGTFLAGVLLFGLLAGGRQRSTRDYFLGGRSLPWWAVALSIIATETSAVTYIGTPGLAYRSSWHYLQMVAGFAIARFFLAAFFIRAFYRADTVTVYGFLRQRFGEGARLAAAFLFLCGRVVGSAVRLYAACLALQVAAGWEGDQATVLAIACLGTIALAFTLLGGIKAVVWSECILGTAFIAGGVIAALCILERIPGGLGAVASLPEIGEKLRVVHLAPPPGAGMLQSAEPLWIGLLGGFFMTLATHGTDQDTVQRVLTCPDGRSGGRSLIASAAILIPLNVIFLSVGTLLWAYHRLRPETVPMDVSSPDDYLLRFIAREAPVGLAGLILAGLFSAAVSSHTSVLNALASTAVADFYRPHLRRGASEGHYLLVSRLSCAAWAVVLAVVAAAFIGSREAVLQVGLKALTYFYGALLGVFLLGLLTRRGTSTSAVLGMAAGVPPVLLLQLREFLADPSKAPSVAVRAIEALPDSWRAAAERLPLVAWPLWIVAGAAVSFSVGALAAGKRA